MGKSMNLNNLTPEEAQQILKVIQKDFELRQKERDRLSKIEEDIQEEENKTVVLTKQQKFNENCCIRCCQTFGIIFNRKQTCQACKLYVCKGCSVYDDALKGYTCKACLREAELKHKSFDWFYDNLSRKYKRFGSAKVVRTMYKHADGSVRQKFHSDNESDSGYDPSLYSSFGQSGSSVRTPRSRPSLEGLFPDIKISEKQEIDNGLFSPPPPLTSLTQTDNQSNNSVAVSTNGNGYASDHNDVSLDTSQDSIQMSTQTMAADVPRMATTPTQTATDTDDKEQDKKDIYQEAFENTKRTEEAKFKVRFDNLLSDMQTSFENLSPRDGVVTTGYGSSSYGDLMTTYRGRIKDMLVSLSQRLELAIESFDQSCAHNPSLTSQKVRQMISKLVEDRLGESLDLTSDEAVSDLSSLSDDSGEQKSLEDQIAQAVIARVLELHRNQNGIHLDLNEPEEKGNSSNSEVKTLVRSRNSSGVSNEPNVIENVPKESKLTKSDNISVKSDINANISRGRVGSSRGYLTDENIDDVFEYNTRYAGENSDSSLNVDNANARIRSKSAGTKGSKSPHSGGSRSQSTGSNRAGSQSRNRHSEDGDGSENVNPENIQNENYDDEEDYLDNGLDDVDNVSPDVRTAGRSARSGKSPKTHKDDKSRESSRRSNRVTSPTRGEDNGDGSYSDNDDDEDDVDFEKRRELSASNPELNVEEEALLKQEFEKLRSFAKEVVPRPLYEEAKFEEEIEQEPIEENMDYVTVDHEDSQDEFQSSMFKFDKVNESGERGLPDFSDLDYEYHDFGINEVDPDLLSMNLLTIVEETEEELAEEEDEEPEIELGGATEHDWRGNWMFKGATGINSYNKLSQSKKLTHDFGDGIVRVPHADVKQLAPIIGDRDVDEMSSDLSDGDGHDQDLSDEENSFYAKTSEEIARITRKTSSSRLSAHGNSFVQTEGESDTESNAQSSSFSDSGIHGNNRLEQNSFDSRTSSRSHLKLSEELVPSKDDDPKFEIPPLSVTISEGEPAKLACRVAGTQPVDIFWYKVRGEDLEELENSENYEIVKDGNRQNLTMFNMTKADAGQYMCMAINENGQCCQYFILSTKANTMELKAPEFLKSLADVEVTEGQSVKFRCKVKGYPQPRVVWYKDGQILMNQLNYKLEKFGNRDYILAIEVATMDEDAEYCALAKNIAGETRSSAQLIVEPKNKPESVQKPKSATPVTKESNSKQVIERNKDELPDLSYLRLGRSRSSASGSKTSPTSSSSSSSTKQSSSMSTTSPQCSPRESSLTESSTDRKSENSSLERKDENNLANISQKLAMTKESVSDVAEDMLSSSKEMSDITQSIAAMDKILEELEYDVYSTTSDDLDPSSESRSPRDAIVTSLVAMETIEYANDYVVLKESAENIRKVTDSALDTLDAADGAVTMRQKDAGAMATSTPRSSVTERVFNPPDTETSNIAGDNVVATETENETQQQDLSDETDDSHKSEISFNLNPMNINMGGNNSGKSKDLPPRTGRRTLSRSSSNESETANVSVSDKSMEKDSSSQDPKSFIIDKQTLMESSPRAFSPNQSFDTTNTDLSSDSSDKLTVNLGSKRENKEPYQRDYYIVDTPKMQRRTPPTSPRATTPRSAGITAPVPPSPTATTPQSPGVSSPLQQTQLSNTEEKIYMAASTVKQLDNKVQTLEEKMRAVQALQEQDKMENLQGQVARTAAQVVTSEKQVKDIERSLSKMLPKETQQKGAVPKVQAPPPRPITPPRVITPPPVEKPEPTLMKGFTCEEDLPESRTEFNEDYGSLELPSVNRLKAMFGGNKKEEKDSSIKRGQGKTLTYSIHSITARNVPKGQLQKLKETTSDHPHARVAPPSPGPPSPGPSNPGRATSLTTGQKVKVTPNMPKQVYQSNTDTRPSVKTQIPKQSIQIASNVKKSAVSSSDSESDQASKKSTTNVMKVNLAVGNTNRPISAEVTEDAQTFKPIKTSVKNSSQASSQSNGLEQSVKTGNEIDTPEGRKSPKIRSGAISAMSKFWEKKNEGVNDAAPEILEND